MARWAIGDVQGCCAELDELLARIRFNDERDLLWFTGDLVNRGPQSLATLRRVRALAANAVVVLGNHDLHLLAVAFVPGQRLRRSDTLDEVLAAPDREALLGWLLERPLAHYDSARSDLLVHAGLVPQWHAQLAAQLASEVAQALRHDPRAVLGSMYGDEPDRWSEGLQGVGRQRFVINVLTRLRVCTADGAVDLRQKGPPAAARAPWLPWFRVPQRASAASRVIFGHWSALGFHRGDGVLALDTGCVWGGALTAVDLDDPGAPPVAVRARTAHA
ncbi:MAG: symmetrical bis(5'-nucleosyl)-tetraphosphatase [Gammaproteobacteria bacterium]|nr:symmetrical bis(5'-nucleosyl)-tetraphosphatase [Gammaproteobacteria bacterium]MDE2251070.1 symmetrical bis(5'-nucleosyl)-tetraphosphatase [Gammaproteobacteria bacterium]